MRDPAGHITHFMKQISDCIHKKMNGCKWQSGMMSIDEDIKARIDKVNTAKKLCNTGTESKSITSRIWQIRK